RRPTSTTAYSGLRDGSSTRRTDTTAVVAIALRSPVATSRVSVHSVSSLSSFFRVPPTNTSGRVTIPATSTLVIGSNRVSGTRASSLLSAVSTDNGPCPPRPVSLSAPRRRYFNGVSHDGRFAGPVGRCSSSNVNWNVAGPSGVWNVTGRPLNTSASW